MKDVPSYIRVVFSRVPQENYDELTYALFEIGAQGVSEKLSFIQTSQQYDPELIPKEHTEVEAFFDLSKLEEIRQTCDQDHFQDMQPQILIEENKDWLSEWKKHYSPFCVTENLWVYPSWEESKIKKSHQAILIDPGLAFGTGTHATTLLCLKALYDLPDSEFKTALDMGAGTGILSVFLKQSKVESVTACEIDALARDNCRKNLNLNSCKEVKVLPPEELKDQDRFDLVVANIIDGVLLKIKEDLFKWTKKKIILSGILNENEDEVLEAFKSLGLKHISTQSQEEWLCMEFEKQKP